LQKLNPDLIKAVTNTPSLYQNAIPENILQEAKKRAQAAWEVKKTAIENDK